MSQWHPLLGFTELSDFGLGRRALRAGMARSGRLRRRSPCVDRAKEARGFSSCRFGRGDISCRKQSQSSRSGWPLNCSSCASHGFGLQETASSAEGYLSAMQEAQELNGAPLEDGDLLGDDGWTSLAPDAAPARKASEPKRRQPAHGPGKPISLGTPPRTVAPGATGLLQSPSLRPPAIAELEEEKNLVAPSSSP